MPGLYLGQNLLLTRGKVAAGEKLAFKAGNEVHRPLVPGLGGTGKQAIKAAFHGRVDGDGCRLQARLNFQQTTPTTSGQALVALVEVRDGLDESALATDNTGVREDGIDDGLNATGHVCPPTLHMHYTGIWA